MRFIKKNENTEQKSEKLMSNHLLEGSISFRNLTRNHSQTLADQVPIETDELSEHEDVVKPQCCILRMNSKMRVRWEALILLLAVWNGFSIPYSIAFYDPSEEDITMDIVNFITDVLFFLDVIVNFRTTIIDKATNEEVFDTKIIARMYMKGRFWIDLLASVPFDIIISACLIGISQISGNNDAKNNNLTILSMLGLLKLVRILRLSRLITFMNVQEDIKMSLKLVKLIFFLVLYLHFVGCMWYFLVKQDEEWIPPLDYVWVKTEIYSKSHIHQYSIAIYHSILVLAGNDIGPRDEFQMLILTLLLLMSAIINANIFGNIAVLLQQINRKATKFQEKMENASSTMKNLKIPEAVKKKIHHYLTFTNNTLDLQNELDIFLSQLSPSLKNEVMKVILKGSIIKNPVFRENSNVVESVIQDLQIILFMPEDTICKQSTEGKMLYFIAVGECSVFVNDDKKKEIHVNNISEGEYFGEVALLKK